MGALCPHCGGPAELTPHACFDVDDIVYRCPTAGVFVWRDGRAVPCIPLGRFAYRIPPGP